MIWHRTTQGNGDRQAMDTDRQTQEKHPQDTLASSEDGAARGVMKSKPVTEHTEKRGTNVRACPSERPVDQEPVCVSLEGANGA